jgi:hypothetical protein
MSRPCNTLNRIPWKFRIRSDLQPNLMVSRMDLAYDGYQGSHDLVRFADECLRLLQCLSFI